MDRSLSLKICSRKSVLITGGFGFNGSHLCTHLTINICDVLCFDNLYSGYEKNIAHFMTSPHAEFVRNDVTYPFYAEVDEIYNLACPASPIHYQHDPVQTTKTSVHGAINVLGPWRSVPAQRSPKPQQMKSMEAPRYIRRRMTTGVTSTQSEFAAATTRANVVPRLWLWTITYNIVRTKIVRIFNKMDLRCILMMEGSFPTLSYRPSLVTT